MLEPDRIQLETFATTLFRHAGTEGFASLRAFFEDKDAKPFRITGTSLAGGLPFLIEAAEDDARRAANHPRKVVFCPPLAIFGSKDRAREVDVLAGLALSVECDSHPREALAKLELVVGPPTFVVASGGKWTDPATGQVFDKLHLHWRLRAPARGADITKLKQARDLAARYVGGDPSNKPVCHPIRWPGSWHRKAEPVLCHIEEKHDRDIDLDAALAALVAASPQQQQKANGKAHDNSFTGGEHNAGADGTDWTNDVHGILTGADYHGALVRLAAKMVTAGMSDGAAINMLRGLMEASGAPQDDRWRARYDDIPRAVTTAAEKYRRQPASEAPPMPLPWVSMSNWDSEPAPERKWAIPNRSPLNQAGLFSGHGGTGKSIVELTKNVAHVAGKDWLGSMPEMRPAFSVVSEDEKDEIHRRLAPIAAHYGVTFKDLVDGGLHVLCLLGQDATLCAATGKSGKVETTPLYKQLYEAAGDIKPVNISIDTLSRAFAGNEIDRVEVYGFAQHMQALAMVAGASVTVVSHPSLQGMSSGSGISGSTAWHNAFRFRHYLTSPKPADGEQPDSDLREFEFHKNQYGTLGQKIVLRYQDGLFLPEAGVGSLDKLAADQQAEEVFLAQLAQFTRQGRNVSDKPTSPNYAPSMFCKEKATNGVRRDALAEAMRRLFAADKIHVANYGRPSRPYSKLVAGPNPEAKG
jgi:RecA-family ATPase